MNIDHALDGKVPPRTPLPKKNEKDWIKHNLQWLPKAEFFHTYCDEHHTDICIKPCDDCLKLLDKLLKKYNILSDIEV